MTAAGSAQPGAAWVRIRIGTTAIRARFGDERPPVRDDDWDQDAYVDERRRLYAQALEGISDIRTTIAPADPDAPVSDPGSLLVHCPDTGDLIRLEADEADMPDSTAATAVAAVQGAITSAVQRVLADRNGWRRHLRAAWFERHRAWRARVGSPIQH